MINEQHLIQKLKTLLKEYLNPQTTDEHHKHHEGAIKALLFVLDNKELNEKLKHDRKIFDEATAKNLLEHIDNK